MIDWIDFFPIIANVATCISVVLLWRTTKANNERKKKEITIQYSDTHNFRTNNFLSEIYDNTVMGKLDIDKVLDKENTKLLWDVYSR